MIETIRSALNALISNKLRSGLTILGIIIGVWAIVSMQSLVAGFERSLTGMMSQFGTEIFFIRKFPAMVMGHDEYQKYSRRKDFTLEDADYLERHSRLTASVAVTASKWGEIIKYQEKATAPNVKVTGASAGIFLSRLISAGSGRLFSKDDVLHAREVALLGQDVAEELFPFENPVGKEIQMSGHRFTVNGVLEALPGLSMESPDNIVLIPITRFERIYSYSDEGLELMARAKTPELLLDAMDEVTAQLRIRRQVPPGEDNDFEIFTGDSIIGAMTSFTGYLRAAAVGIAGISLIVAGIGIMNIMLVAVLERTREIGTRKALGARNRDILWQFLIESIILSEFGAVIGIGLGYGTSVLISSQIPDITPAVPVWAVVSAVIYCSAIGIIFGSFPARKAARLDPIEALHYE